MLDELVKKDSEEYDYTQGHKNVTVFEKDTALGRVAVELSMQPYLIRTVISPDATDGPASHPVAAVLAIISFKDCPNGVVAVDIDDYQPNSDPSKNPIWEELLGSMVVYYTILTAKGTHLVGLPKNKARLISDLIEGKFNTIVDSRHPKMSLRRGAWDLRLSASWKPGRLTIVDLTRGPHNFPGCTCAFNEIFQFHESQIAVWQNICIAQPIALIIPQVSF